MRGVEIETERLVLRQFTPDDLEPLAAILLHPEVARWLGPPDASIDDVARAIDRYERHWETRGYGRLAVCDRVTGGLLGRAGVVHEERWTATTCKDELGWATERARWGEGLATEAARAVLRDAFERAGLREVIAFTTPTNTASLRVMAKLGLERRGTTTWAGGPHVWAGTSLQPRPGHRRPRVSRAGRG